MVHRRSRRGKSRRGRASGLWPFSRKLSSGYKAAKQYTKNKNFLAKYPIRSLSPLEHPVGVMTRRESEHDKMLYGRLRAHGRAMGTSRRRRRKSRRRSKSRRRRRSRRR
jgi:hypothetical protein